MPQNPDHGLTVDRQPLRSDPPAVRIVATCSCLGWDRSVTCTPSEADAELDRVRGEHRDHQAAELRLVPGSTVLASAADVVQRRPGNLAEQHHLAGWLNAEAQVAQQLEAMHAAMGLAKLGMAVAYQGCTSRALDYARTVLGG